MMKLLNLGCGTRHHDEWTNIDFCSTGTSVMAYDLRKGIPLDSETFDVVYHSNLIEHFSKEDAQEFLKECYRVLRYGGILRIAYPDLEQIVLHYIRLLKEMKNENLEFADDYDWIMLELYDQTVRNSSGGDMAKYFIRDSIPNKEFVLLRCGVEAKKLIQRGRQRYLDSQGLVTLPTRCSMIRRIIRFIKKINLREYLIQKLLGVGEYKALSIGRFRLGGEIHQWMYDSYSLSKLLRATGFKNIVVRDAFTSYLENWQKYNLDTEPDGSVYKPDSSYIEAIK
jgi:predicted SAM-dependent methyltransferase